MIFLKEVSYFGARGAMAAINKTIYWGK